MTRPLFAGTVGSVSVVGLIDPISGPLGTLEYDHGDGISITGGFVYHGTAIPELQGKYVFGDLALHGTPTRTDGRLFYADLTSGLISEFQLPQFAGQSVKWLIHHHCLEVYQMQQHYRSEGDVPYAQC